MTVRTPLGIIGLGEAGIAVCTSLSARSDIDVVGYDQVLETAEAAAHIRQRLGGGISYASSIGDVVRSCDMVLSLVTSSACIPVARQIADHSGPRTTVLDANSVSPETSRTAAAIVEAAGSAYVDIAVMAAVQAHSVPMLASGPTAGDIAPTLRRLGFEIVAIGSEPGAASAAKMMRSVIVKGIEALLLEALAGAAGYGVTESVLASLDDAFPVGTWRERADYFAGRTATHGVRRADEMDEAARSLEAVGVTPMLTRPAAARLRRAAGLATATAVDHARLASMVLGDDSDG